MKTTFIITNFNRFKNLPHIVKSIKEQSVESEIFIWNNNPSLQLTQEMFSNKIDILINSSKNLYCSPRWDLSKYSKNDFVFILDDDIFFSDKNIVEHLLVESKRNYLPGRLFGVEGVILNEENIYFDLFDKSKIVIHNSMPVSSSKPIHFANPKDNINVDIVKGRLICFNKNDLFSTNPPPQSFIDKADDITYSLWFSSHKKYHMLIGGCNGSIKDFEDKNAEYALSMEENWKSYRNTAVKELIKIKNDREIRDTKNEQNS